MEKGYAIKYYENEEFKIIVLPAKTAEKAIEKASKNHGIDSWVWIAPCAIVND